MTEAFGITDTGPVRSNNEDCFVSAPELNLFAVADGMGGEAAGEVASRLAIDSIQEFVGLSQSGDYFTWPFGLDPNLSDDANRLRTALRLANQRILEASAAQEEYTGMGTTAVCALLSGSRLTVAHVGDSRVYLFAGGVLSQLTNDDSWAALVAAGDERLTPGVAQPSRNVLTSALGAQTQVEVHLCERELLGGEIVLLCSDGLHGVVSHETLRDVLADADADLERLARTLLDTAVAQGTHDNVTALVVRYRRESEPSRA